MIAGIGLFSLPAILGLIITDGFGSLPVYFALLSVVGLGVYAIQAMYHDDWTMDEEKQQEISTLQQAVIAISYYNFVVIFACMGGLALIAQGYPLVGVGFALLLGPADVTLAERLNASPITLFLGLCFALGSVIGYIAKISSDADPRTIVEISTLQFRRNRRLP
ncbi:hypothetical protein SAMN04488133_0127 [Halobellus limi]|nr:hypothetical protein SAMN04488133_0127 [Halobellus limi]